MFMDRPKRSMTNVVENEEFEKVSHPPALVVFENETSSSETEIKEGELVVNQVLEGNAQEILKKKVALFQDKCSKSITNIKDNEEHETVSLPHASLNIENKTSGKFF